MSNFHFEQPVKQEENPQQKARTNYINSKYGHKSDREMLEERTHLAQLTVNKLSSINSKLGFFVWMFCLSALAAIIIAFTI